MRTRKLLRTWKLLRVALLATALAVGLVATYSVIGGGSAHAQPATSPGGETMVSSSSTSPTAGTFKTVTVYQLPASRCRTKGKVRDCTHIHTSITTAKMRGVSTTALANNSCADGSTYFDDKDQYYPVVGGYQTEQYETFYWFGDCAAPAMTAHNCRVIFIVDGTIDQFSYFDYTTSVPSHAAVCQYYVHWTGVVPNEVFTWFRRECFPLPQHGVPWDKGFPLCDYTSYN